MQKSNTKRPRLKAVDIAVDGRPIGRLSAQERLDLMHQAARKMQRIEKRIAVLQAEVETHRSVAMRCFKSLKGVTRIIP